MHKTAEELAADYAWALEALIEKCEAVMRDYAALPDEQKKAFPPLIEAHIERLSARMKPLEGLFGG